jgi:hypothetical protein
MRLLLFSICVSILLVACSSNEEGKAPVVEVESYGDATVDSLVGEIESDYDMSDIDPDQRQEFAENLIKIEKEDGIQWDFCKCVVKNDSLDKAFKQDGLSDLRVDDLMKRLDFIEIKCQAYLIQNTQITPDQRADHEKKVQDCLKEAGLK